MALFSRKKKDQDGIALKGFPGHVDTCKCLYLAAEKGVRLQSDLLDVTCSEHDGDGFRRLSPFGKVPCLVEGDVVLSGAPAVLSYLDIRGGGQSLTPRKAARLGEQNYWIEVGQARVAPAVDVLIREEMLGPMCTPGYAADKARVAAACAEIDAVLTHADRWLADKDHFAGEFSFADVHWAPYLHFCGVTGHGDLLAACGNLQRWMERIKARKNGTARTYEVLPTQDRIRRKDMRFVA